MVGTSNKSVPEMAIDVMALWDWSPNHQPFPNHQPVAIRVRCLRSEKSSKTWRHNYGNHGSHGHFLLILHIKHDKTHGDV